MWQRFDWQQFGPQANPRVYTWYRRLQGRPGWVWKFSLFTALIVFALPVILLTFAAVLVGAAVFTVLSLVARGILFVRHLFDGASRWSPLHDDGRRNVRVRMPHDR